MGRGNKYDFGTVAGGVEIARLREERSRLFGGGDFLEGTIRQARPDQLVGVSHLQLGNQTTHAVADEDHVLHGLVALNWIQRGDCRLQFLSEHGGGLQKPLARWIAKNPELESLRKSRRGTEVVDQVRPTLRIGKEP